MDALMPTFPLDGGPHHEGAVDVALDHDGRPPATVTCLDAEDRSVEYHLDEDEKAYSYAGFVVDLEAGQ